MAFTVGLKFHIYIQLHLYCYIYHQASGVNQSPFTALENHPNWNLLPIDDCGESELVPKIDIKVVGGHNADIGQFPWMANIFSSYERQLLNEPDCGGVVISDMYIVSAGHCCEDVAPEYALVRVGEYNLNLEREYCTLEGCIDPVQNVDVEDIRIHENFSSSLEDDICLIRLRYPVQFNEFVQPICLPVFKSLVQRSFSGEDMEIAGWGYSNEYRKTSTPVLQTAEVPVVSQEDCRRIYSSLGHRQICAGSNLRQFCMGDSGGPLMKEVEVTGRTRYFLFGIVSYIATSQLPGTIYRACDLDVPGVFSRVTSYLEWILDNMES